MYELSMADLQLVSGTGPTADAAAATGGVIGSAVGGFAGRMEEAL